jgi:hypothetical protein
MRILVEVITVETGTLMGRIEFLNDKVIAKIFRGDKKHRKTPVIRPRNTGGDVSCGKPGLRREA